MLLLLSWNLVVLADHACGSCLSAFWSVGDGITIGVLATGWFTSLAQSCNHFVHTVNCNSFCAKSEIRLASLIKSQVTFELKLPHRWEIINHVTPLDHSILRTWYFSVNYLPPFNLATVAFNFQKGMQPTRTLSILDNTKSCPSLTLCKLFLNTPARDNYYNTIILLTIQLC